jgi:thiosulfate dehydrogenase
MKAFIIGVLIALFVLFPLGAYLFARLGYMSLATSARPLPGEGFLAQTALRASIGAAADQKNPLAVSDENLLAGAQVYREHCAVCHGLSGQPKTEIAAGMFPKPPQLLEKGDMVTDDPEGATQWVVTNGIRLSGMPAFAQLSDPQRWQVTLLLKHADKLPATVQSALAQPPVPRR